MCKRTELVFKIFETKLKLENHEKSVSWRSSLELFTENFVVSLTVDVNYLFNISGNTCSKIFIFIRILRERLVHRPE